MLKAHDYVQLKSAFRLHEYEVQAVEVMGINGKDWSYECIVKTENGRLETVACCYLFATRQLAEAHQRSELKRYRELWRRELAKVEAVADRIGIANEPEESDDSEIPEEYGDPVAATPVEEIEVVKI